MTWIDVFKCVEWKAQQSASPPELPRTLYQSSSSSSSSCATVELWWAFPWSSDFTPDTPKFTPAGYCMEKQILVYDYVKNGSLEDALWSNTPELSWSHRVRILYEVSAFARRGRARVCSSTLPKCTPCARPLRDTPPLIPASLP
eukprot:6777272-Pyramimonas_sp.AAC.3